MGNKNIPVSEPTLLGNEEKYVLDCLRTNWISSVGQYTQYFEESFASFCSVKHAIAVVNGTAALHVALLALGVKPGDEVIVPTFTYVATANAVSYCGGLPAFADCEPDTWNLDINHVQSLITPRTRGIIPVHIFGHPVDMDPLLEIAEKHHLFVLEDAAEAHGALYKRQKVGAMGDASIFSFYGNKIITTGEGGMITTNDDRLAERIRLLKGQGMDPARRYWHPVIGYNYRMTNIQAAIGLAQLEQIEELIRRHRGNAYLYSELLRGVPFLTLPSEKEWAKHVYWVYGVLLGESGQSRDAVMEGLASKGIETRPFFYPVHTLPPYENRLSLPVAESVSARGIILPSSANLSDDRIRHVCQELIRLTRSAALSPAFEGGDGKHRPGIYAGEPKG
jgi:perosamine synthetase